MLQNTQRETEGADVVAKLNQIDQHAVSTVVTESNHGLMMRLFPTKRQRDAVRHELSLAKTEWEFREKAIKIARDAQLLAITEMHNDFLIKGKTGIRRERTEFVLDQKIRLENELMKAADDFNQRVMTAYQNAEKITVPRLKEKYLELIDDSIESFHSLAHQLKHQFQNILNEGVET